MTHVNDTHGQRNDLGAQPPKTYNGDIRQLPPALEHLRDEKVWVIWCWEWNGKKWTKEPYRTDKPSKHASSSDPDTWGTHGQAWAQVHSGNADGIGFTLQGRGIGTVDLDDCRDLETGDIAPWAQEIVDQFPGAYIEITVSGTGLRIIGTSDLKDFAPKHRDKGVEFFSNCNFYNTLSCNALVSPAALLPIGDKMKALDARLKGAASHQSGNGAAGGPNVFELFGDSKSPKAAPEEWSQKREDYIRAALDAIPTDETTLKTKYDPHMVWHDIGRGLDRLGWGERGYAMWREWCRRAPEYNEEGLRKNWVSFAKHRDSREEQITVKRIFDYATAFGWVPPEEKESQSSGCSRKTAR
jgi:Primase C terminal 2 (PriCT-2)